MMFEARKYQKTAVEKIFSAWHRYDSILLQAATGAGKTIIAGMVMDRLPRNARVLFNVHTKELVDQPIKKLQSFFPHLAKEAGIVQAERNQPNKRIISATFQTLSTGNFARLHEILTYGPIDYLIEDECRRSLGKNRRAIIEILKSVNPNLKILGLDATPFRTDGTGMNKIFDYLIEPPLTIKYLTGLGHLVPLPREQIFEFELPVDFTGVKMSGKGDMRDYVAKEIEGILDVDNVHEIMFDAWSKHGRGLKTLAFTAGVKQALHLAEYFSNQGQMCAVVAGSKKSTGIFHNGYFRPVERKILLDDYEKGGIDIIFNCLVLTEGFDSPVTKCLMLCRPFKSAGMFIQVIGRGLRLNPGSALEISQSEKKWCRVLSFSPVNAGHMLKPADMYGRRPKERKAIEKALEEGLIIEEVVGDHGLGLDCPPDKVLVKNINILSKSKYAWLMDDFMSVAGIGTYFDRKLGERVWHGVCVTRPGNGVTDQVIGRLEKARKMNLSNVQKMVADKMEKFLEGDIAVWYYKYTQSGIHPLPSIVDTYSDIDSAIERAESYAEAMAMEHHGNTQFIEKKQRRKRLDWRSRPMSDEAKKELEKQFDVVLQGETAGNASKSLFYKMAKEVFRV